MSIEQLREQISEYCKANHVSGALRVTVKDKVEHEQYLGFADMELKLPFTKDSMFTLYSLSKPFCAIGLLILRDQGLVDLDSHPAKYVPEANGFDERVTIRHLLHHISGLPDFSLTTEFSSKNAPGYSKDIRSDLKQLTECPAYFAPGTSGKYANINFILCALIIENVSGLTYSEYMEKEVFKPLGMKNAVVDNENMMIPHRVKGYGLSGNKIIEVEKRHRGLFGAGDIVATVDDVYCLNKAIKHQLLLSKETWQEVLTPSPLNRKGMGCTVSNWHGKKRITHNGGHTGFRTLHIQLPEDDFDIIFLSNSGFGNARVDLSEMIHSYYYKDDTDKAAEKVEMDQGYI